MQNIQANLELRGGAVHNLVEATGRSGRLLLLLSREEGQACGPSIAEAVLDRAHCTSLEPEFCMSSVT